MDQARVCRELLDDCITYIYEISDKKRPTQATLLELLDNRVVYDYIGDTEVIEGLHFVRRLGMNAMHVIKIREKDVKLAKENMAGFMGYIIDKSAGKDIEYKKMPYMSESNTRKIYIDMYLREAGWEVLETEDVAQPGKAGIEIRVEGMPNESEEGFCDYVLYGRDGKPLAIVEAKKTSVSPTKGRHQVDLYGDCMKAKYGYKPILYYTNGYEIKIIDGIYPDRQIYAFHTIDELERMIQQRSRASISDFKINEEITNRPYQKMAITSICERLNSKKRRGLLVMATGTGKTRVAISLVELLARNKWIKNVLFLADRTSLVRQAKRNFSKYLDMPICELSGHGDKDLDARLMFSTYQTMINYIDAEDKQFSTGRFDLIIIDEAHRSVFNRYGSIFKYFDSFLVGLTATPKGEVGRSTYDLLQCEQGEPCFDYSLEEAIKDKFLVGYETKIRESKFLRKGIKYGDLSDDEKEQLDDYFGDTTPDGDYVINKSELYSKLFNENTCAQVLEDLMDNGLRVNSGETIGKTIIFAYNHKHAEMIVDTFYKLYPQYSPNTCQLVDYSVYYAEDLVVKFGEDDDFRIAVSVDMLDTGIDVEQILNLVFFKPVYSKIKFVQMIGRGTRLCPDIYGPGKNKTGFRIFDYCGNFEYFGANSDGKIDDKQSVTMTQRLFETRVEILRELQGIQYQQDERCREYYKRLKDLLYQDVKVVKTHNNRISVREKMKYVDKYYDVNIWTCLSPVNTKELKMHIAPLIDSGLQGDSITLSFDIRMLKIEIAILAQGGIGSAANEVKGVRLMAQRLLQEKASINKVIEKADELKDIVSDQFWGQPSVMDVEEKRESLRDIMKYLTKDSVETYDVDITDEIKESTYDPGSAMIDIRTYREKVIDYLAEHSDSNVIRKIHNLEPINSDDLKELEKVLWEELGTQEEYKKTTDINNLAAFVRSLIGLSQEAINEKFGEYLSGNTFNLQQQEFIKKIIDYVQENGDIEVKDMVNTEPFDDYNLVEMFGESWQKVVEIINILHNRIEAA
ncbi:MAG: DEAD/DEAH box helicase family protein [Lachnospiraceae bacterium]|nr:DEAD/DEAH box helicase family protein [Lachnospiraceae bacterium]